MQISKIDGQMTIQELIDRLQLINDKSQIAKLRYSDTWTNEIVEISEVSETGVIS